MIGAGPMVPFHPFSTIFPFGLFCLDAWPVGASSADAQRVLTSGSLIGTSHQAQAQRGPEWLLQEGVWYLGDTAQAVCFWVESAPPTPDL